MSKEKDNHPYIPPVTCVRCGQELKPISPSSEDPYGMVEGGVVGKIFSPFGSENDGTLFQIGICDKCIKEAKLKPIGDYMDTERDAKIKHDVRMEGFKKTGTYRV